jgi:AcrR family transcriptional regulator
MPLRVLKEPKKKTSNTKSSQSAARAQESRREPLLEAAAELFATKGYSGTSMRDIASAVDMLAGSIYYHFDSKEQILLHVYDQGVNRFSAAIQAALAEASAEGPWERLEAACVGHLTVLLEGGPFTRLGKAEFIQSVPKKVKRGLIDQRDRYEMEFERIIDEIPVKKDIDRLYLKMLLLGGLTSTLSWYRPGSSSPSEIARSFVSFVRDGVEQF